MPELTENDREYLDNWLDHATQDLCPSARAKVCEEMTARYADALAEARAAGLDEDQAAYQAYVALGDSREARRKFARVYLTEDQADMIRKHYREPSTFGKIFNIVYGLGLILLLLSYYRPHPGSASSTDLTPVLVLAALICLLSSVALFCWNHLSTRWRLFHKIASQVQYVLFFFAMDRQAGTHYSQYFMSAWVLVILSFSLISYPIWLKLRRHPEVRP